MYLSEVDVKALLNAVVAHFPGGQMIFDVVHPMILKQVGSNVGGTGATYKWGLDDPQDIKQLEPKLELIKEFRPSEQVVTCPPKADPIFELGLSKGDRQQCQENISPQNRSLVN